MSSKSLELLAVKKRHLINWFIPPKEADETPKYSDYVIQLQDNSLYNYKPNKSIKIWEKQCRRQENHILFNEKFDQIKIRTLPTGSVIVVTVRLDTRKNQILANTNKSSFWKNCLIQSYKIIS